MTATGAVEPAEIDAIRTRVAYQRSHVALLSLKGDDAQRALLHLCPSRLFLRDAQVKESLLLDDAGRPVADVLVCADDEDYLLLVDGLDAEALGAHVAAHLPDGAAPTVEDLGDTHAVISMHGPWAWHLASTVLGPDLVALPYLNFFRVDAGLCVRAGKTGEFGYDLIVARERADEVFGAVADAAAKIEGREVSAAALALCRFEAWFFDPAHVPEGVTPLELQLAWRLDLDRTWVGRDAVDARMEAGVAQRLMCMLAGAEVRAGDPIRCGEIEIGRVTRAARSETRGEWIAAGLIDLAYAQGGVDRYRAASVPVRTVAPPLIDNRSLYVDPRRHTWEARDEIPLSPLVRGDRAPEPAA